MTSLPFSRALVVRHEPLEKILSGEKTWEIRGSVTHIRGSIGLIAKGTGLILGCAELIDCFGPLSMLEMLATVACHRIRPERLKPGDLPFDDIFAWRLHAARRFDEPLAYSHPRGAVRWVRTN